MECQSNIEYSMISHDILKTLLYFDIFHYPLNIDEIANFSNFFPDEIEKELDILVDKNSIYKILNFYSLSNDKEIVAKRIEEKGIAS